MCEENRKYKTIDEKDDSSFFIASLRRGRLSRQSLFTQPERGFLF